MLRLGRAVCSPRSRRSCSVDWAAFGERWLAASCSESPRTSVRISMPHGRHWHSIWCSSSSWSCARKDFSQRVEPMTADSVSKAVVPAVRVALALAIMLCAAGPWIFNSSQLTLLTEFFTVLVLVLVWNLLAGFADIVSVGQHAFVGVGAYAFYGLTVLAGLNVFAAIPLAMLIT